MPYSGGSDSSLPAHIKKMSAKRRRQFVHVWNSMYERTRDEGRAFAAANAAVKRKKELDDMVILTRGNKSVKVTMYSGADDPDLPDHVKGLSLNLRSRWVNNYNWCLQECMDDTEAEEHADEYTTMSISDMMEMGVMKERPTPTIEPDEDEAEADEDEAEADEAESDEDELVEAAPGEMIERSVKAVLTSKKRGSLRKSQFAYVDSEGKGHLPIHDAAHVRNALARFNQTSMPASAKAGARRKIVAAAKRLGVKVSSKSLDMQPGPAATATATATAGLSWFERFKAWLRSDSDGIGHDSSFPVQAPSGAMPAGSLSMFNVFKGDDGPMHFLTVYSNNFKDKEKEIISEAAHKEYAESAEVGRALYPDAHLWHAGPHTKWGTVETVSYVGGFAVAGGVVEPGREHVALKLKELADKGEIAVSFGFYGLRGPDGVYHLYRPFEISPLPVGSEANPLTTMDLTTATKENGMAFSDKKKSWLKEHFKMDDVAIAASETAFEAMGNAIKAAGIDFKEQDEAAPVVPPTPSQPPAAPVGPPATAPQGAAYNPLLDLANAVKGLSEQVAVIQAQIKANKEADSASVNDRANDQVLARIAAAGGGYSPASAPGNIQVGAKEQDDNWLDKALGGVFNMEAFAPGAAGGGAAIARVEGAQ